MADDPTSDDGIHPIKTFQGRHILVDKPFLAVSTTRFDFVSCLMDCDISALRKRYSWGKKNRANPSSWNLKRGNSGRKKPRGWFF
jgi:hypothetical protein